MKTLAPALLCIAAAIVILIVVYCFTRNSLQDRVEAPPRNPEDGSHWPANAERMKEVVHLYESGELSATPSGQATLPAKFQDLSLRGVVIVSKSSQGGTTVLFVKWQGKGANFWGFLYAKPWLSASDITNDYYGQQPGIDVLISTYTNPSHPTMVRKVRLDKDWGGGWYQVSYDLD